MQVFQSLEDKKLLSLVKNGAVGVLPTDTVYGLVCSAGSPEAVERLFTIKPRSNQPGTVLAASIVQLTELGMKKRYLSAVEHYWPNPLSIIIPCGDELSYLHMGLHSLAVRIPADKPLGRFLTTAGPLMTTSANLPGAPVAETLEQAQASFGNAIDFYVDGGSLAERPASTIIRVIDDAIEIVRRGAIDIDETGKITS